MKRKLLVLLFCAAGMGAAYAGNNRATDAAFAALLSMPGAEPESGQWNFPQPSDFQSEDEKDLIAYLARQQKAGADVNAYRHHGSLLHHAIRAGKGQDRHLAVAAWR